LGKTKIKKDKMKKIAYKFSETTLLLFAIAVWLFSIYKVISYVSSLNFWIFGKNFDIEYFWEYPLEPPSPPEPPCPPPCPPCPPPCVTPTLIPTPTVPIEPTPTPTKEPLPTPTSALPPSGGEGGGVGGPPGPAGSPHCGAQTPPTPYLRTLKVLGSGEVELLWDPVEPSTHYSISYGPSSGNYLYGVANTGKVSSFKVGSLGSGTYCFAVRAVNDCAPGELSNERCTGEVLGVTKVLGVSTLGATGDFSEKTPQILFIIGCLCLGIGLKLFLPAKRLV